MEIGPHKLIWQRWPAIITLFAIGCFGAWLLYAINRPDWVKMENADTYLSFWIWGLCILFTGFGFIGSTVHYCTGLTFQRIIKVPLEDVEILPLDNGMVVGYRDDAKIIRYHAARVKERGYIKIKEEFNRHKVRQNWSFMDL